LAPPLTPRSGARSRTNLPPRAARPPGPGCRPGDQDNC
jgi:hypothetical protein